MMLILVEILAEKRSSKPEQDRRSVGTNSSKMEHAETR